jgi:UDP-3-O-[3-hydroxymyristoyl] glucosamine N-acyltransferase
MIKLSALIDYFEKLNLKVVNLPANKEIEITGGKNISEAGQGEITFLGQKLKNQAHEILKNSKASLVIIDGEIYNEIDKTLLKNLFVVSDKPKDVMVACLTEFFVEKIKAGIHATAILHPNVKQGKNNFIGPYTIIEEGVVIGNDCIIESGANIKKNTIIGNRVKIKTGAVIGGQGFGYVNKNNKWENFPHFGNVVIEDDVEIGSNTCIDRGALGSTILKKGVKIDNLVHIAHNVIVGENSLVIADAMVGGSAVIGENTWVAPSVAIRNGITIGSGCTIGMGAIVTKSVDDGVTVVGNPAAPFKSKQ